MAEEFEESEVIFSEEHDKSSLCRNRETEYDDSCSRKGKKKKQKKSRSSGPVNIPSNMFQLTTDTDDQFDDELVPPHVIIGRRIEGKLMAFSLCSGNGRTLKGRDLSQVRNSILRLTGFLET
ncbi:uncharacterized protein LOC8267212 [Ricinus communis]|uniref:Senescence regulator n=1 Tax=Ricinus communis TaxID=3988 RepID=B9S8I0_RICCO|nr:uncharacterized protein LOC8267212 [Ricinus communis]EEF40157.1 conserved hypothetical protein [Ricinus communis]|eukprot:XP_002522299.1 uncharacterized protein LOC8267212 [Ricinus communis]